MEHKNVGGSFDDFLEGEGLLEHSESVVKDRLAVREMKKDYVLMPKELTAENGTKGLLMGEFEETMEMTCPECDGDDADHGCEICNGEVTYLQPAPVSWTTIKAIYKMAVDHFAP